MIEAPGGLWDEAKSMYKPLGGRPTRLRIRFTSGMKMRFAHLEKEDTVYNWQGSQITYIGYDELTHITRKQFFYMLSRGRSDSGVSSYIRATCNPDPDSWVAEFIEWWIDQESGYPIPDRDGLIRWFVRHHDKIVWASSKAELWEKAKEVSIPQEVFFPKSVTFIASKLEDNPILMKNDPAYVASLEALDHVERMRLRHGNWKIRAAAGNIFKSHWFDIVDAAPARGRTIRYWDRASTKKKTSAFTAGVKMRKADDGTYYILDVARFKGTPGEVTSAIKNMAAQDGYDCEVGIEQDPGSAGVFEADHYAKALAGFIVRVVRAAVDKVTRAKPLSAQSEHGNVKVVRGDWNKDFLDELQNFPDGVFKDQVDAASGAFNVLSDSKIGTFTKGMGEGNVDTMASVMNSKKDMW